MTTVAYTFIEGGSRTGFPVTYAVYGGGVLWNYYGREIRVGDEILKFIGKVTIDKAGNLDVDLTGLGNFFASSALFTHHTDSPYTGEVSVLATNKALPGSSLIWPYAILTAIL